LCRFQRSRAKIEQLHIVWLNPEKVVQEQKANDRPGLIGAGLLANPGAGGPVKVFSPLLAR
jgi:hypothetical protein